MSDLKDASPLVSISCISNVYMRMMNFKEKGHKEFGHKHFYDHAMIVAKGSILVKVYDEENDELLPPVEYKAPASVFIRKMLIHEIESLEDDTTTICVHALRDETDTIISPSMLPVPTSLVDTISKYYQETQKELLSPAISTDQHTDKRNIKVNDVFGKF